MLLDVTQNLCTDIRILNILVIFKTILKIATIVVPVILTIIIVVDIIKTISSSEVETKKLYNTIIKRASAAVLIFMVPYIIKLVMGLIPMGNYKYVDCYNNAEKEIVAEIAITNANYSLNELEEILSEPGFDKEDKASKNKANVAYEKARKDIKLIPNDARVSGDGCTTKNLCKAKLDQLGKKFK